MTKYGSRRPCCVPKRQRASRGRYVRCASKGNPILLAKVEGQVFGVSNRCPHMGCQLQGGILSGFVVICPCHGWRFDVRNGQYQENP